MNAEATATQKSKPAARELTPRQMKRRKEKLMKSVRRRKNARHG